MDGCLARDNALGKCGAVGIGSGCWSLKQEEKRFISGIGEWLQ